jgi:hypothetical protein
MLVMMMMMITVEVEGDRDDCEDTVMESTLKEII